MNTGIRNASSRRRLILAGLLVGVPMAVAVVVSPLVAQPEPTRPLTAEDYVEIQQLYARYVHALDGGDAETYAGLFTPDGSFNEHVGRAALVEFVKNRHAPNMRHVNTSLVITPTPEGAEGSVYNLFLNVGEDPPVVTGASQYHDTLVRTPDGWRFKTRVNRHEGPPAPRH